MFRKFDETVQSNKIAKFLFENNFTAMDVNRIYCEVYKCEKLGLEYDLKNLIKETFELKRHSKRSLLNKRLDLNEVAPPQAPLGAASKAQAGGQPPQAFPNLGPNAAQKKAAQEAQANIQTQITNILNTINSKEQLAVLVKYINTQINEKKAKLQAPAATQQAPAATAPAPASNPKAPAAPAPANKQPQQQAQAVK